MKELTIVKAGGKIIENEPALHDFLKEFASIPGHKILVHGGGKQATDIGNKMGLKSRYIRGRRVTDDEVLELIIMVYGGLINKKIVAYLQGNDCNAIGLTGADGNMIMSEKRPVVNTDYGHVGDVKDNGVNRELLQLLLNTGLVPILAPLTHDGRGNILNTNADTIAQEAANAFAGTFDVKLIYCFEKRGVLQDADDDNSVISTIRSSDFHDLKEKQVISGGMIPKLENAFSAIDKGVRRVVVGHASELAELINGTSGTHIH